MSATTDKKGRGRAREATETQQATAVSLRVASLRRRGVTIVL